ncbi:MAG: YihY/virulence factor BrkB family protein [Candidatus Rokubacteria bacterium]|nr:YihY/virulence factor BrkB family protein [Candidatus Rokubacteria bacterium]
MLWALRVAVVRFVAADGFFLAAGLAFCFLLCVIPLILLGVSTVGFVLSTEQAQQVVVGELAKNFPVYRRDIMAALLKIVEGRTLTGVVGTVVLVLFSTPLFSSARLAMHRLLGVRSGGNFLRNLVVDAGMVLLFGVFLFGITVVTWVFYWVKTFVLEPMQVPGEWIEWTNLGLSLSLSSLMFFLGYRYVPYRRVRAGAALPGALLASGLWEIAKQGFRIYIRRVALYDQIYGPLGVLVAFVMFVYYSAVVFVFGAAYVSALDARRR